MPAQSARFFRAWAASLARNLATLLILAGGRAIRNCHDRFLEPGAGNPRASRASAEICLETRAARPAKPPLSDGNLPVTSGSGRQPDNCPKAEGHPAQPFAQAELGNQCPNIPPVPMNSRTAHLLRGKRVRHFLV